MKNKTLFFSTSSSLTKTRSIVQNENEIVYNVKKRKVTKNNIVQKNTIVNNNYNMVVWSLLLVGTDESSSLVCKVFIVFLLLQRLG